MKLNNCSVPGCKNSEVDEFLKFYSLPYKDKEVCKEWIRRIGEPKLYMQHVDIPEPLHKICEIHFHYMCKTGSNSELHRYSLPTLYLPIIKSNKPKTNCFFEPLDLPPNVEKDKTPVKPKEEEIISLQLETYSEVCCICFKKGILYNMEKSMYNGNVHFASIIKSLLPEQNLNSCKLGENICLECTKLILISYFTIIRISSALTISSIIMEPLSNNSLPRRIVNASCLKEFNMKSILNACKLEISLESIKAYHSEQCLEDYINKNSQEESVNVPPPIIELSEIKMDVNIPLPEETEETHQLPESISMPKPLAEIKSTSENSPCISSMHNEIPQIPPLSIQSFEKTAHSIEILGMSFNNTNNTNNITGTDVKEEVVEHSEPLIQIVKLDLSKSGLTKRSEVKLPTSKELKEMIEIAGMSKQFQNKTSTTVTQSAELIDLSTNQSKQKGIELVKVKLTPKQLLQNKALRKVSVRSNQKLEPTKIINTTNTIYKLPQTSKLTRASKPMIDKTGITNACTKTAIDTLISSNSSTTILNGFKLKQYGNKRRWANLKLINFNNNSKIYNIIDDRNPKIKNDVENSSDNIIDEIISDLNEEGNEVICIESNYRDSIAVTDYSTDLNSAKSDLTIIEDHGSIIESKTDVCTDADESMNDESESINAELETQETEDEVKDFDLLVNEELSKERNMFNQDTTEKLTQKRRVIAEDSTNLTFQCSEMFCEFTCESIEEYAQHISSNKEHTRKTFLKCSDCNDTFDGAHQYKQHLCQHKKDEMNNMNKMKEPQEKLAGQRYICAHCGRDYHIKRSLSRHLERKHGKLSQLVKCPTCFKKVRRYNMPNHKHKKIGETRCTICCLSFGSSFLFKQHELEYHPKVCLICSKKYATVHSIRMHMLYHIAKPDLEIKCEHCPKMFKSKRGKDLHMKSRNKYKVCINGKNSREIDLAYRSNCRLRVCPICGKSGTSNFSAHMRIHLKAKSLKCDHCDFETRHPTAMKRHELIHSGDKPFLCAECGTSFRQKVILDQHMKMHVISPNPIQCHNCVESFKTKYERREHVRLSGCGYVITSRKLVDSSFINKQTLKKKYSCIQCDRTFCSIFTLRNHIVEKHEERKQSFSCHHCNMKFDTFSRLTYHKNCQHMKRLLMTCKICETVFPSRQALEGHSRVHTGERPFKCDICPSMFKLAVHLQTHKFGVHEDRRPFPCTLCDKAFRTKTSLKEHVRTHTKERLKCEHCDKTFAGNSNRCKHMREVHKIRSKPVYSKI